jgi:hypothetical protein
MTLQVGSRIRIHGFVMMEKLDSGDYKVLRVGTFMNQPTYTFAKARGKKPLVTHFAHTVDGWINDREDLNRIEVLQ